MFSPDGRSLAFWSVADATFKRIAVSGGAPMTICSGDNPYGMSWGSNNEIVFGQGNKGIMRVSANGGKPETIVTVKSNELAHGPQILPGGRAVLFTLAPANGADRWEKAKVVVQTIQTGARKTLIEGGTDARYVATGHIIYALNGTLLAVPFDAKRLDVTGGSVPIVEDVRAADANATGTAQFGYSETGSLIYIPGTATTINQSALSLVDRNGSAKPVGIPPGPYSTPRISPNGKQLAFGTDDGKEAIVRLPFELSRALHSQILFRCRSQASCKTPEEYVSTTSLLTATNSLSFSRPDKLRPSPALLSKSKSSSIGSKN